MKWKAGKDLRSNLLHYSSSPSSSVFMLALVLPGPGCKTSPVWALLMLPIGVPTEECWHRVCCLWQAHGQDSGSSESPPSPRLHMPSHWVVRIILVSLERSVFLNQLWKGGKGLLRFFWVSWLPCFLVGTGLRKAEAICKAAPLVPPDPLGQMLGAPSLSEDKLREPKVVWWPLQAELLKGVSIQMRADTLYFCLLYQNSRVCKYKSADVIFSLYC